MKADPDRIRHAAARMANLADALWDEVDLIRRDAEELMEASWAGVAATTHAALWTEWVDSARQIFGVLTEDASLLDAIAAEYDATDHATDEHVADSGLRLDR